MATEIGTVAPYKKGSPPDFGTLYSGRALEFDGVTDYVSVANTLDFRASGNIPIYTISFWINPTAIANNDKGIMSVGDSATDGGASWVIQRDAGVIKWINQTYTHTIGTMVAGQWSYVVITYDGTDTKTYFDGVLASTRTETPAHADNFDYLYMGVGNNGYFDGNLSNVQIWDKAWSLSDVQYAYKHPEKLITHNSSVTSGTTISNLKAWYPCTEGNPRSPQTTVYDGSPKELGSELITNGDFSGTDITSFTSSTSNIETPVIEDGTLKIELTSTQGYTGITTGGSADGNIYKLTGRVKVGTATNIKIKSLGDFGTFSDVTYTNTDWVSFTHYAVSSGTNGRLKFELNGSSGQTGYLDDISFKEVKMGNHGTTTFVGLEQISHVDDRTFSGTPNWANYGTSIGIKGFDSYDESGDLTVRPDDDASNRQVAYLDGVHWEDDDGASGEAMVSGRTYRLSYDLEITGYTKGTLSIGFGNTSYALQDVNSYTADTASATRTLDFVYGGTTDDALIIVNAAVSTALTANIDNFSIKEVGVASGWTTADAEPLIPQTALMAMSKPMVFDGVNNYVKVDDAIGDLGSTASISAWVNRTSTAGPSYIFDARGDASGGTGYAYFDNGSTTIQKSSGTMYKDGSVSTTVEADGWHHIVITGMTLDIDEDIKFGSRLGGNENFIGVINEVSVWNKTLSLAEVQTIFNDGVPYDVRDTNLGYNTTYGSSNLKGYWRNDGASTWTDLSGNTSSDGDVSGSPDTILLPEGTTSGKDILGFPLTHTNNGWLNLSGSEYVKCGESSVLNIEQGLTLEAWIKTSVSGDQWIVARDDNSTRAYYLIIQSSSYLQMRVDSGSANAFAVGDTALNDGDWHHVVGVYVPSTSITVYIDNAVDTATGTNPETDSIPSSLASGAEEVVIGVRGDGSDTTFFDGQIDELKIYNRALSEPEIEKNWKHGKSKHS